MRRQILYILYIIVSCASGFAEEPVSQLRLNTSTVTFCDTATWTGRMQRKLDSLVNLPLFQTTQLGLYVYDLNDECDLFCVNNRHRMRPASNQKVVTAITALNALGGDHKYRTQMFLTGEVRDSILMGNIHIVGDMDPMLSQGEVEQMVLALRQVGIDSIAGIIGIDLTMKNSDDLGWGWCWDDDVTPLRPLMVEKKDIFTSVFLRNLALAGIRGGSIDHVMLTPCPQNARMFCEVTHTINDALVRMMKKSDNYYAESMFYKLAALSGSRNVGRREGAAQVNNLIKSIGLDPSDYQIADGSGVSLYNYLTPQLLVRLLQYAWKNDRIRESLYQTMPIAGIDGTLEKRMRGTAAEGNIHAKTGTVNGVSSLSGYATSPEGHILVFSIINQGIPTAQVGRDWQDKVCETLCK